MKRSSWGGCKDEEASYIKIQAVIPAMYQLYLKKFPQAKSIEIMGEVKESSPHLSLLRRIKAGLNSLLVYKVPF